MHADHWDLRRDIIFALNSPYSNWEHNQAKALAFCCQGVSFMVDPATGKVRPWLSRCRNRMCLHCSIPRSINVARRVRAIVNAMDHPRLVILTVRSTDLPLKQQLAALRRSCRRLRLREVWKLRVTGGVYTIEITRNPKTGLWHPHLNAIIDGKGIPRDELCKAWYEVTDQATGVWISKVRDNAKAVRELTKYIGKPQDVKGWPPRAICDYAWGISGTHLVEPFGKFRNIKLEDDDVDDTPSPDAYQVPISRLVHLASRGADSPQELLVLITHRWPQFRSFIYHQMPWLEKPDPLDEPTPANKSPPRTQAQLDEQDTEIFIAFCCFHADDVNGLFTHLDWC